MCVCDQNSEFTFWITCLDNVQQCSSRTDSSCNWKFVPFSHTLASSPFSTPPLRLTTNMTSFSLSLYVYLFVFYKCWLTTPWSFLLPNILNFSVHFKISYDLFHDQSNYVTIQKYSLATSIAAALSTSCRLLCRWGSVLSGSLTRVSSLPPTCLSGTHLLISHGLWLCYHFVTFDLLFLFNSASKSHSICLPWSYFT